MSETPDAHASQDADQLTASEGTGVVATSPANEPSPSSSAEQHVISEEDYEAIAAAVMETERGRWFLKEYARRNRNADTQTVLTALERLEDKIGEKQPGAVSDDASVALLSHNVIDLAEAITQVKREVQELGGKDDQSDHFNTATEELEAIVAQTETATGEILEAAEKVQEVLWALREEGANETQCDIIDSKIIDIYTACSFQDLTGQRSSKVVRLVAYVEKRVSTMMSILGLSAEQDAVASQEISLAQAPDQSSPKETRRAYQEDDERSDSHLLHGPSSQDEANQQDDVDALFNDAPSLDVDHNELEIAAEQQANALMRDLEQVESTSEADIFTNESVIEIHDAEILLDADEMSVAASSLADGDENASPGSPPDVFEVDPLAFDGPDMAEQLASARAAQNGHNQLDSEGQSMVLAGLPDNFAIDQSDEDIFVDAPVPIDASLSAVVSPDADTPPEEKMQDIFDVELVEEFSSDTQPEELAMDEALEALAEDTTHTSVDTEDEMLNAEPLDGVTNGAKERDTEPVPYTDEERIALFS